MPRLSNRRSDAKHGLYKVYYQFLNQNSTVLQEKLEFIELVTSYSIKNNRIC